MQSSQSNKPKQIYRAAKRKGLRPDAAIKGFFVGSSMSIPGVSGGTMAMILGIYGELIRSVSSFFKNIKKHTLFLLQFVIGAGLGFFLLASLLGKLKEAYPVIVMYFFIGAILGSVPMLCHKAQIRKFSPGLILFPLIGFAVVFAFGMIPKNVFSGSLDGVAGIAMQVVGGLIASIGLILPGISFSHIILLMGLYDTVVRVVNQMDIQGMIGLIPLAIGLVLGIILFTRIMEICMNKYPFAFYLMIFGFVIGSVADKEVFPGLPRTALEWILSLVTLIGGFLLMYFVSRKEARSEQLQQEQAEEQTVLEQ